MQAIDFDFSTLDGDSTLPHIANLAHISRIFLHDSIELQGKKDTSMYFI